jgi:hypothetical protein
VLFIRTIIKISKATFMIFTSVLSSYSFLWGEFTFFLSFFGGAKPQITAWYISDC